MKLQGTVPMIQISIMMPASFLTDLDRIASKIHISRSRLIQNCVACGLSDAKALEKVGLADLAGFVRGFQDIGKEMLAHSLA